MSKRHIVAFAAFLSLSAFTAVHASAASSGEVSLSHDSGLYDNSQLVTIVNHDGSSDIYYTTDGSKPDTSSSVYDGSPIVAAENMVIRMVAYDGDEVVGSDKITMKIRSLAPVASVSGGEYTDTIKVELTSVDPKAEIYYTTDGTTPTKDSAKYKKVLTISETTTLKFAAYSPDRSRSKTVTEKYSIDTSSDFDDPMCQALFELVNETRAEYGLKPLKALSSLTEAAQIRAKEYSYYQSHYRPDGSRWDTVLSAYGLKTNVRAENLAYYYTSAKQAMKCWMSDSFHRGNILNPDTEYIGLACYNNGWCNYWCQLFIG